MLVARGARCARPSPPRSAAGRAGRLKPAPAGWGIADSSVQPRGCREAHGWSAAAMLPLLSSSPAMLDGSAKHHALAGKTANNGLWTPKALATARMSLSSWSARHGWLSSRAGSISSMRRHTAGEPAVAHLPGGSWCMVLGDDRPRFFLSRMGVARVAGEGVQPKTCNQRESVSAANGPFRPGDLQVFRGGVGGPEHVIEQILRSVDFLPIAAEIAS